MKRAAIPLLVLLALSLGALVGCGGSQYNSPTVDEPAGAERPPEVRPNTGPDPDTLPEDATE